MSPPPPSSSLFPYTTLFRSQLRGCSTSCQVACRRFIEGHSDFFATQPTRRMQCKMHFSLHIPTWTSSGADHRCPDRKSTRLNSSHPSISYAVFCLKKKKPQF